MSETAVQLLMRRLGEAHRLFLLGQVEDALWQVEFAASELERRREHLLLADELADFVFSIAPNRRRQLLRVRILESQGKDAAAAMVAEQLLPRDSEEQATYERVRKEFLDWLGAEGRAALKVED